MILYALDALRLDSIAFVGKNAWRAVTGVNNALGFLDSFALSLPETRQTYITWDGIRFIDLAYPFFHEFFEVVSYDAVAGEPLVTDCHHSNCLMNESGFPQKIAINSSHLMMLDRNKDGVVSTNDIDINSDNTVSVGLVMLATGFRNAEVELKLRRCLHRLLPAIPLNDIRFQRLTMARVRSAAGESWRLYD